MFPTSQGNHPGDLCLNGPCNKHHILRPFSILSSQLAKPHGGVKQGRQFPQTSFLQSGRAWTFTRAPAPANKRTSSPYVPTDGAHLTEQCVCLHTDPGQKPTEVTGCFSLTSTGCGWGRCGQFSSEALKCILQDAQACLQISHVDAFLNTNLPQLPCKCTYINTPLAPNSAMMWNTGTSNTITSRSHQMPNQLDNGPYWLLQGPDQFHLSL